jgi:hypothetical protein
MVPLSRSELTNLWAKLKLTFGNFSAARIKNKIARKNLDMTRITFFTIKKNLVYESTTNRINALKKLRKDFLSIQTNHVKVCYPTCPFFPYGI